jgi:hypothetical protein
MRNRRTIRPPDMTSLFDVLFLFVFVSLINAGMSRRAADVAEAAAAKPPPAPAPPSPIHDRALAQLGARPEAVVHVTAAGVIDRIELADRTVASDVSLVERVSDPDVALAYRGDRDRDLRVCGVVARALDATKPAGLRDVLVVIAPAAATSVLPHALVDGLRADEARCGADTGGLAVIVEPQPPQPPQPQKAGTP